jgi:hypothetical protein
VVHTLIKFSRTLIKRAGDLNQVSGKLDQLSGKLDSLFENLDQVFPNLDSVFRIWDQRLAAADPVRMPWSCPCRRLWFRGLTGEAWGDGMPLFQRAAWLAGLRAWAGGPAGSAHLNTLLFKNIAVSKYYGFSKYFLNLPK